MAPQLTLDVIRRFPKNGPTDPIAYYSRPLTGWLFRERINIGLRFLEARRYKRALEVGYGSGAVLVALSEVSSDLHGVDLDADPALATRTLDVFSVKADLRQGNVYALPYPDAHFDLVASFSMFEHLSEFERALGEVHRVRGAAAVAASQEFAVGLERGHGRRREGVELVGLRKERLQGLAGIRDQLIKNRVHKKSGADSRT